MKILLSCIGNRDPLASDGSEGAFVTAFRYLRPDRAYLFPTKKSRPEAIDTIDFAQKAVEYVRTRIDPAAVLQIFPLETDDPTDYRSISDLLLTNISAIKVNHVGEDCVYHVSISSGTAQIQALWLMLNTVGVLEAKLWQVREPRFAGGDAPELRVREVKKPGLIEKYVIEPTLKQLQVAKSRLENLQAARFEDEVAEYLRREYGYDPVYVRYSPPFLQRYEADVYAIKIQGNRRWVSLCECKLRTTEKPVTLDEIQHFIELMRLSQKHEQQIAQDGGQNLKLCPIFITNCPQVEPKAYELAQKSKIELSTATIPQNWMNRSDWTILKISTIK